MPSFQSPMPISGRPCAPVVQASPQRAQAVLVHGAVLVAHLRQIVHLVLVRLERPHGQEGHLLVEHRVVAGDPHVVVDHVRQPGEVVGEPRAHAAAALRMPPVLHVALDELARRRAQDVLARHAPARRSTKRHHVLQLVAEAVRAAALVERRARPHPAGQRLVERPAVDHRVERRAPACCTVMTESRSAQRCDGAASRPPRRRRRSRYAATACRGLASLAAGAEQRRRSRASRPAPARARTAARRRDRCPAPVRPASAPGGRSAGGVWPACRCGPGTRAGRRCGRHRLAHRVERHPPGELRDRRSSARGSSPAAASNRVRTWCCVCSRSTPSVHSTYA